MPSNKHKKPVNEIAFAIREHIRLTCPEAYIPNGRQATISVRVDRTRTNTIEIVHSDHTFYGVRWYSEIVPVLQKWLDQDENGHWCQLAGVVIGVTIIHTDKNYPKAALAFAMKRNHYLSDDMRYRPNTPQEE